MEKLYIVIPAYNEEANIERTLCEWYSTCVEILDGDVYFVVVDDGSRDSTLAIVQKFALHHSNCIPLSKPNGGHGSAVLYGYRYAIENSADYVFQTDADGQTNPQEFLQFWAERSRFDAIIGNRIQRGDGKVRKIIENIVCLLLRLIFGVRVKDANAPFRLMKADLIRKYIHKLPIDFNLPNIMFTTYFVYFKEKVAFYEISFKPRQAGKNTINMKRIFVIGLNALFDFVSLRKNINK